jgi:ATP-dependent RNA helicase DeaD
LATRSRRRSSASHSASARRAATCWAGRHRHRQDGRLRAAVARAAGPQRPRALLHPRAGAGAHPRVGDAGRRGDSRYGRAAASSVVRGVRRAADLSTSSDPLKHGVDVVVATPGRALDHLRRKHAEAGPGATSWCSTKPTRCSTWASPKTSRPSSRQRRPTGRPRSSRPPCPPRIAKHRRTQHLNDPVQGEHRAPKAGRARARAEGAPGGLPRRRVAQGRRWADARRRASPDLGARFLPHPRRGRLAHRDAQRPRLAAEALHGGMSQEQRDRVMKTLQDRGDLKLLIATDVAARGLDVDNLSHVVNYDVPFGRPRPTCTASAERGAPGARVSRSRSPSPAEHRLLKNIERVNERPRPARRRRAQAVQRRRAQAVQRR